MLCEKVLPLLSEFLDEVLDDDQAVQVNQHLGQCIGCRKEYSSLSSLRNKLRSMQRVHAPEVLHRLVKCRLAEDPWPARVRNELERCWSIIRTTEAMWYATRAVGTVVAAFFFVLLPAAITPYLAVEALDTQRASVSPAYYCLGQQPEYGNSVGRSLSQKLGMSPTLRGRSAPAAINPLYLVQYGRNISEERKEDTFSVVTTIDRSGAGKVETVLEHPEDQSLLTDFRGMVETATFRPARENGKSVASRTVFTFSKVFVSE